jgi:hypothetical protein
LNHLVSHGGKRLFQKANRQKNGGDEARNEGKKKKEKWKLINFHEPNDN